MAERRWKAKEEEREVEDVCGMELEDGADSCRIRLVASTRRYLVTSLTPRVRRHAQHNFRVLPLRRRRRRWSCTLLPFLHQETVLQGWQRRVGLAVGPQHIASQLRRITQQSSAVRDEAQHSTWRQERNWRDLSPLPFSVVQPTEGRTQAY